MKNALNCSPSLWVFFSWIMVLITVTASQISIERIDQMPHFPQPYEMRDWKKVAHDFDALAFDLEAEGDHLPLVKIKEKGPNSAKDPIFTLPTFVGWNTKNGYEAITCLGAINAATVSGIDKRKGRHNWVELAANFFIDKPDVHLYMNSASDKPGKTFWYELLPNIIFYRIYDAYPDTPKMAEQFITVADRWYEACIGMGGGEEPYTVPDFNHTSYNFKVGKPFNNGLWKEGGSAAAIAWIGYMAYEKTDQAKYLLMTKWGLDFLQKSVQSPFYEALLPHGAYLAARVNAETGSDYDAEKLTTWCFNGKNKRGWGESLGKWGELDCAGLAGACAGKEGRGYAFAKNTFNKANSLVPMVRYDDRFAHAIGKWMLNAANSARLYYANSMPAEHQTDHDWYQKYDPQACLAYEGLKTQQITLGRVKGNYKTIAGKEVNSRWIDTHFTNKKGHTIEGKRINHTWELDVANAVSHRITILAETRGDANVTFSYATDPEGEYQDLLLFPPNVRKAKSAEVVADGNKLYLRVTAESDIMCSISADDIWVKSTGKSAPFATGDAKESGWAETNFGLYGSAYVGIFGGIIDTTNVEGILKLDCLATDYFRKSAYPTYLYYNPYEEEKRVTVSVPENTTLYDAVSDTKEKKNSEFILPPLSAKLIVHIPDNIPITIKEKTAYVKNIPIDYNYDN